MNNKVFIYILVDPRLPELARYVGRTKTPQTRHLQHCSEPGSTARGEWLEELRSFGIMPQMIIVATVDQDSAENVEKAWIKKYKPGQLTNICNVTKEQPVKPTVEFPNGDSLQAVEKAAIAKTLVEQRNNKLRTARVLGIGRQTLYNKLKSYKIQ